MLIKLECPCCKGPGWLELFDANFPDDGAQHVMCCHCSGKGYVEQEQERLEQ